MKIKVHGSTPLERLTNLTRAVLAAPKSAIERAEKKRTKRRKKR